MNKIQWFGNNLGWKFDHWVNHGPLIDYADEICEIKQRLFVLFVMKPREKFCFFFGHKWEYLGPGPWDWDGEGTTYCSRCSDGDERYVSPLVETHPMGWFEEVHYILQDSYYTLVKKFTGRDIVAEQIAEWERKQEEEYKRKQEEWDRNQELRKKDDHKNT